MASTPKNTLKDKNYDLIRVLEVSLRNAWHMDTFITDAERAGDEELAEWFREIQRTSSQAGEQGKAMLLARLKAPERRGSGRTAA